VRVSNRNETYMYEVDSSNSMRFKVVCGSLHAPLELGRYLRCTWLSLCADVLSLHSSSEGEERQAIAGC